MAPFAANSSSSKKKNNLIAILLVTRSRPGPKLVFHYPPIPAQSKSSRNGYARDQDDFSDDDNSSDSDGDGVKKGRDRGESESTARHVDPDDGIVPDDPLERLFGHSVESLERLLCPGRWSNGEKFEIGLDGITFVGHPVYAKEDGSWTKASAKGMGKIDGVPGLPIRQQLSSKSSRAVLTERTSVEDFAASSHESNGLPGGINIAAPAESVAAPPPAPLHDFTHMPDSLDSRGTASLATSMNSTSTTSGLLAEQLSMFHVVFALATSPTSGGRKEALKAKTLHEELAKKFSKALKYCQKQNNYLSLESRRLLALKSKAKPERLGTAALWTQMLESSELAWALRETFEQISQGEIATIRLDGLELSLQIPLPLMDPTTSSSYPIQSPDDINLATTALLLLIDKDTLLRAANLPPTLAYFIRETTPTKSLLKQSTNLTIPASTLSTLAHHLVTWRKARFVAPLHPRNTYIPNPDTADSHRDWRALSAAYSKNFPALPSLERMLSLLGRGVKYGMLIQSRDHRIPYMEILAWLMCENLVVQMRTFGWLTSSTVVTTGDDSSDAESSHSTQTAFPASTPQQPSESTGLILDPTDPSPAEAAQIRRLSAAVQDDELRDRIPDLLQSFDGQHAFEEIAAREGLKRAKVEGWLSWLEDGGWVKSVRYV